MSTFIIRVGIVTAGCFGALLGIPLPGDKAVEAPIVVPVPASVPVRVVQDPPSPTTTIPKATVSSCDEVLQIALDEGWPASELAVVRRVVFRESRCLPAVVNLDDPGKYGSIGLFQLNSAAWCLPSKYWPTGYLQAHGVIEHCFDLYNATINIRAALVVWQYGEDNYGYGWGPWAWLQSE